MQPDLSSPEESQNALIPQKRDILHSLCPQVVLGMLCQDARQLGPPQMSRTPSPRTQGFPSTCEPPPEISCPNLNSPWLKPWLDLSRRKILGSRACPLALFCSGLMQSAAPLVQLPSCP